MLVIDIVVSHTLPRAQKTQNSPDPQRLERIKAPVPRDRWMDDGHTLWSIHTLEYYVARNKSEVPNTCYSMEGHEDTVFGERPRHKRPHNV